MSGNIVLSSFRLTGHRICGEVQHLGLEMLQSGISVLVRVLREHNKSDKKLKKAKNFVKKAIYFLKMWKDREQAFTKVGLYTVDDHTLANDNYLQIFVELPKLVPERGSEDFGNLFLRAMRDIGKSKVRQKEYTDRRLDTLFDASSYNHLSDEEQKQYEESMTTVEDLMSYARVQREEGKAEIEAL